MLIKLIWYWKSCVSEILVARLGGPWAYSEKDQTWGLAKLLHLGRSAESLLIWANLRSNLDGYFQHCKPVSWLKRQTKILANPFMFKSRAKFIFWDMHIFSLWCYWIFFVSLLSFPRPFIAQIWKQHFRCTKGIESTFPSQSGGVWVSNISLTDFLGGKKTFFFDL